ncbi:hypothetical protein GXW83_29990 [Streptacidiphilus sp. PB12-B1b]|uniref:hypothetical protein n=1 Tax=Streptacidiphilus sp. PB12-B1b TaxID=2705012 RepID=UPI0015F99FCB|nr:hypothetical protein [Streptacidiphilus sp. PB12-B1b]QMU79311.1 hypothetical protein GXW83_29990 [Streptacidiphilus sp. PB12-B1b]
MSNGPVSDQSTEPLPRRGVDTQGRIPTSYGPENPVREHPDTGHYRVRPGAPNLPIPEPQRAAPLPGQLRGEEPQSADSRSAEPAAAGYVIRPGAPGDPAHAAFEAMAERKHVLDRRRRRIRWGAAGLVLCCLVAVCVALLTPSATKKRQAAAPRPTLAPSAPGGVSLPAPTTAAPSTSDEPSTTPSPTSLVALLSSAATDRAPITAAGFFPGRTVSLNHRSYTRAATADSGCAAAASQALAAVLTRNGCREVLRATYTTGTTAVTVGVAVFDDAAQAAAVRQQAAGNLTSLPGGGVAAFCRGVVCRLSVNAVGRYAYFTVAGYTSGKPVPADDTAAFDAGNDMNQVVLTDLGTRAGAEAAAH